MSTVREEYEMACPKCGRYEDIKIAVIAFPTLTPDGIDIACGDTEWDDDRLAYCDCGFSGLAKNFKADQSEQD